MNTKLLGSALIISGTALGAGMLAIPMVLAQFGLMHGSILMLGICAGTTYAALLLLEATIKVGDGLGMNSIARKLLGKSGQFVTNALLYALLICLLMAYILGAADFVTQLLGGIGVNLTSVQSQILFTLVAGGLVAVGTDLIDKFNRCLFLIMLASLGMTLLLLAPSFSFENLYQVSNSSHIGLIKTSAILFTSFGFMVVIPSLVAYNHEATDKQLRNMVILGSVIPLICYLFWLFAVVGNLQLEQLSRFFHVSDLIRAFESHSPWLSTILSVFTGLALLTSFFGVAMALFHQNSDLFKKNKLTTYVLTFIVPLAGALLAANQFLSILSYAGVILVFLAVFIPLMFVHKIRKDRIKDEAYTAEGGTTMLAITTLFGLFLLISQII
ncbi:amino acid permease [uncultured Vibrio sp.]|uniref:amino acid permease n=1 Tax=uncultured Vibrio sp. TaxID=114054 RepID=UPI0009146175|nr:aromatic amino acid transport family protein [uncultured Vibrio sp.]OIQ26610.1 MAG: tyrosine transporter [Vibrio sp. MedPE-SWchi]